MKPSSGRTPLSIISGIFFAVNFYTSVSLKVVRNQGMVHLILKGGWVVSMMVSVEILVRQVVRNMEGEC